MRFVFSSLLLPTVFAALVATSAAVSAADKPRIDRVEIVDFGIGEISDAKTEKSAAIASGVMQRGIFKVTKHTKTIPARKNLTFGYTFRAYSKDTTAVLKLTDINIVPPPGLKNPKTGNVLMQEEAEQETRSGQLSYSFYTLAYDWTLLPGVWKFQLFDGDRKLSEIEFTLVKE